MNKQCIPIIFFLFFVCGCATTINFSPAPGLDKENISLRSTPAKISKESNESLEKKVMHLLDGLARKTRSRPAGEMTVKISHVLIMLLIGIQQKKFWKKLLFMEAIWSS